MSERKIALLACTADYRYSEPLLDWLSQVDPQGTGNAARYVAVNVKFQPPQGIRTFNVETDSPAELAQLATHANWAETGQPDPQQHVDARALFALHRFVQAHREFDEIILVSGYFNENDDLSDLLANARSKPFHWVETDHKRDGTESCLILHDRKNADAGIALNIALDIALTGAIYAIEPYRFIALLDQSTSLAALVNGGVLPVADGNI